MTDNKRYNQERLKAIVSQRKVVRDISNSLLPNLFYLVLSWHPATMFYGFPLLVESIMGADRLDLTSFDHIRSDIKYYCKKLDLTPPTLKSEKNRKEIWIQASYVGLSVSGLANIVAKNKLPFIATGFVSCIGAEIGHAKYRETYNELLRETTHLLEE